MRNIYIKCAWLSLLFMLVVNQVYAQSPDPRNILTGYSIYENSYIDQPYMVTLKDGSWLCVFTTGAISESMPGQHIVASRSYDKGLHWTKEVSIEPNTGPISSWAIPYLTSFGRIYVFYNYNGDNVSELKGKQIKQLGLLGWYCYKYSDDDGETWSTERYRLPLTKTSADLKNDFDGKVQMFWGIDKPLLLGKDVLFAFTKLGKFVQAMGEGWYFKSDNLDKEKNVNKIHWELLPQGDTGIKNPAFGSVQEEFNTVILNNGDIYCMYRTTLGFPACTYSRDSGKTWSIPQAASYTPGGQIIKTPRACPRLFKCKNGKYLFWFHNHSGKNFKGRNPAWIVGGIEKNGLIYWSQPEILLYDNDLTVNGMSYPDLMESNGKYWISETQKTKARVHYIDVALLNGLWNQASSRSLIKKGMIANWQNIEAKKSLAMPILPNLKQGGFTIDLWINLKDLKPGKILLDSRDGKGKGIWISTSEKQGLRIDMSNGIDSVQGWDTDSSSLKIRQNSHVVFVVDGAPNIITTIVDGKVCDGGASREYGWGRFSDKLEDINGSRKLKISAEGSKIKSLRIYDRYLTTSEVISNFHYDKKSLN